MTKSFIQSSSALAILLVCAPAAFLTAGAPVPCGDAAEKKQPTRQFYFPDQAKGTSRAVSVATNAGLIHTVQVYPLNGDGSIFAPGDAHAQVRQALENLGKMLEGAGGDVQLVKLNVYVTDASISQEVQRCLASKLNAKEKPAVTFVVTRLPLDGALIAVDAVAVSSTADAGKVKFFGPSTSFSPSPTSSMTILPPGPRVYISGQAEKGDGTLADATTKTLASLVASLKFCGLERGNIVQLKAFMSPMRDAAIVEKAAAQFFDGAPVPPLILVEWKGGGVPIEIELIASSPGTPKDAPRVEYLTPPGLKKSPVYSRIARVNSAGMIYVGGLAAGREGQSGLDETRSLFPLLKETLSAAGGDLEHMVKATYYVTDAEVSGALGKVRPEFYNPDRPPTASKAEVSGTGLTGNRIVIDMIAAEK